MTNRGLDGTTGGKHLSVSRGERSGRAEVGDERGVVHVESDLQVVPLRQFLYHPAKKPSARFIPGEKPRHGNGGEVARCGLAQSIAGCHNLPYPAWNPYIPSSIPDRQHCHYGFFPHIESMFGHTAPTVTIFANGRSTRYQQGGRNAQRILNVAVSTFRLNRAVKFRPASPKVT